MPAASAAPNMKLRLRKLIMVPPSVLLLQVFSLPGAPQQYSRIRPA
jgi:hypothetical protein